MSEQETAQPEGTEEATEAVETTEAPAMPQAMQAALRKQAEIEASIRERTEQFKAQEKAAAEFQSLQSLAKEDPLAAFEKLGIELEQLENLKTEQSDPTKTLRQDMELKMQQLQLALEQQETRQLEDLKQKVVDDTKAQVAAVTAERAEEFPLISAWGDEAQDLVFQTLMQGEGKVSDDEAFRDVEAKLQEIVNKAVQISAKTEAVAKKPPSTLTNALSGQATKASNYADLTPDQARQLLFQRMASLTEE